MIGLRELWFQSPLGKQKNVSVVATPCLIFSFVLLHLCTNDRIENSAPRIYTISALKQRVITAAVRKQVYKGFFLFGIR